jgi:dTDP-glucose 4,6-dehydratase
MSEDENLLARDLDEILEHTEGLWDDLRGGRILATGGTGFFGVWILESFSWANRRHGLRAEVVVLSRRPRAFAERHPRLAQTPGIHLLAGDVRSFELPAGEFSHVIHAAGDATRSLIETEPLNIASTSPRWLAWWPKPADGIRRS